MNINDLNKCFLWFCFFYDPIAIDKDLLNEKLKKATEQENASKKKIIMLDREIERIQEQKVKPFQNQTTSKHTRQTWKNPICTFETYVL